MYYFTKYASPTGPITLVCEGDKLAGLWFDGERYFMDTVTGPITERDGLPILDAAKNWLDRYFAGEKPAIPELPLSPAGNEFRRMVWDILNEIPYGEVTTYGEIAKQMAAKMGKGRMSAQAVGGAVGHNPISIIIPCHRVVGAGGNLTGYGGGIHRKIKLLELEGVDMSRMFTPKKGTAL